jgi:hypothetical protein
VHEQKEDVDLSFLNGRELVQVRIGLYQVIFNFDEHVAISVERKFRYFDGQDEWRWQPEPPGQL